MTRGGIIRVVGFLAPAAIILLIIAFVGDWRLFAVGLAAALLVGIPAEVAYRRSLVLERQKRRREDDLHELKTKTLEP